MYRDVAVNTINNHAAGLSAVMDQALSSEEALNFSAFLHQFTLESFLELGFGLKMQIVGNSEEHPLEQAFDSISSHVKRRVQTPMMWKLQRGFNVGKERKFRDSLQLVRCCVFNCVQRSIAREDKSGLQRGAATIVELFIQEWRSSGHDMAPELLCDLAMMFVLGGRDTTADTLCWCLLLLCTHPAVEEKIRMELSERLRQNRSLRSLTIEEANSLPYLEATIKETLRLYPVVPQSLREASRNTVLIDGTFVSRGTKVSLACYAMNRLTSVWGDDALEFKPERFIDVTTGKLKVIPAFQFFSVHAGQRVCIGKNLAMLEMKMLLAMMLTRYRLNVAPNDGEYKYSATMQLRTPLRASVHSAQEIS